MTGGHAERAEVVKMSLESSLIYFLVFLFWLCVVECVFQLIFKKHFKVDGRYSHRQEFLLRGAVLFGVVALLFAIIFRFMVTAVLDQMMH